MRSCRGPALGDQQNLFVNGDDSVSIPVSIRPSAEQARSGGPRAAASGIEGSTGFDAL
jgi:hypothetical protein